MRKFKLSQAALEFLTTYGWVFLVILIMIAALAYFGVLSPANLLPSRCNFGAEFQCLDYQIGYNTESADGTLKLKLKNNAGSAINIGSGKIILSSESAALVSCSGPVVTPPANSLPISTWNSGEIREFQWSACNWAGAGMFAGNKGKLLVKINFYPSDSSVDYGRMVQGEIYSNVMTITGNGNSVSNSVCQNAQNASLCDGLDIVYGAGYKCSCCSDYGLCCIGCP